MICGRNKKKSHHVRRSLENRFLFKWKKKKKSVFPIGQRHYKPPLIGVMVKKFYLKRNGRSEAIYAHGIILKYGFHDIYLVVEMGQKYRLLDQRNQWEGEEEEEIRKAMANYWISITI